ncbi:MAG: glutamate mutase L, partial [bacterium]|nr:glutamate mutase L [bacterium]
AFGKDLTMVKWVIGTGGPLTKLLRADDIIRNAMRVTPKLELYPREFTVLIDSHYNFGVLGVLGTSYPEASLFMMKKSLGYIIANNE